MSQGDLLGPLVTAIETVKQRIQEHGASLRENETRTRVALIDPILQALGWDVSDPSMVTPEFPVATTRADYGLLGNGEPAKALVALEAKRLGEDLSSHRQQMVNYANTAGVAYAGLTNGDEWELYRVFSATPQPIDDRRILRVKVSGSVSEATALKLLLLWRSNIASGAPTEAGEPIVEATTPNDPPTPAQPAERPAPASVGTSEGVPNAPAAPGGALMAKEGSAAPHAEMRIEDYAIYVKREMENKIGTGQKGKTFQPKPAGIRFPDGEQRSTTLGQHILIYVAEWLYNQGRLADLSIPFIVGRGKPLLTADARSLKTPKAVGSTGYFVETKFDIPNQCKWAAKLLESCGVEPWRVYVTPGRAS